MAYVDSGLNIPSIQNRLALQQSRCREEANIPEWMTKGIPTLIQEDPQNEPSLVKID